MELTILLVIVLVGVACGGLGFYLANRQHTGSQHINQAIERIYGKFIDDNNRNEVFDALLDEVLTLTGSEYGFIGEVLHQDDGTPYLKTRSITNIAWNDETRALYQQQAEKGFEFYNLNSLFGAALVTEETVISNNPAEDNRRAGLPKGHPPMHAFMGIALKIQGKLVGLVGIANAPAGYSKKVENDLSPISYSIAQLIHTRHLVQQQHDTDEIVHASHLAEVREELQRFFDLSPDFLCIANIDGTFKKVNGTFKRKLGHSEATLIDHSVFNFIHPDDVAATTEAFSQLERGQEVANFINRYRTIDGNYLSLQWRAMPDPNSGEIYATAEDVTESLRVTDEIKKLSKIAKEIPSMAVITDAAGLITWVNQAFEDMTEYTLQEVQGQKPGDLLQGEYTSDDTIQIMREALRANQSFDVEILNYSKSGRAYWVEIECQPLFTNDGVHEGFLAVQSDITERVLAKADLEYRQKLFEQMSILGNIGAWEYDLTTNEIYWSDVTRQIHGVAPDYKPNPKTALTFYPEGNERERVQNLVKHSIETGESWQSEVEIIRHNGERNWVSVSCRAEFEQGECKKLYGAFQDIHERKLNQIANIKLLSHSQALAKLTLDKHVLRGQFEQAAIEVVQVCAAAINADRVSVWQFNDTLSEMHLVALSDRGVVDPSIKMVLKREDFPQYFSHVFAHTFVNASDARNHPATAEFTEVYLKPLDIHSMLDAVISGGDHFAGVICIEQYQAVRLWSTGEEAFASALATLLSSVYDRQQRKRTEKALKAAAEKANSAAQAKSDFLASMSHEIRTPMNGVLGMLGLILKTELSGDQERKIQIALNSAQSLLAIINDILDFSKIDAGKLSLEALNFDLISLFSEFSETMAFRAEEHNLELLVNLREVTSSHVIGDPGRLRQILTNLVGNALKFTHSGEILIHAKTTEVDGEVVLECSVKDTGIGIPKEKQADLFEQFTQVDTSNTRQYGGTGLGLSIVKRLSEAMGGRVWVESEEGSGSCFTFTTHFQKNTAPELKLPVVDLTGKRVLVVDDNHTNQIIVAEQLAAWGCEAIAAESANKALQICEQMHQADQYFDIALLDMQMPGTDGATLGKMLKEDKRFANIPLVMMTSQAQRGDAAEFATLGFSGYFPKPVSPNILLEAIMVILDSQTLAHANPLVTRHFLGNLEHSQQSEAKVGRAWKGKPRVLLVEDNRINQEVALDLLLDIDLTADVAADGEEALHALAHAPAAHPYTLVLMDCQMPGMDGFEATEAIRRGAAGDINRDITIIALTANAMSGDKERCLDAGMNDYLSKPIDPERLESLLMHWLSDLPNESEQNATPACGTPEPSLAKTINGADNSASAPVTTLRPVSIAKSNGTHLVWDKDSALKRVRGRQERLKLLIQRYTEQSPELISDIFQCVEVEDLGHAADLCHTLRGVASNLGALALVANAQALETTCKQGDCAVAHQLAGELLVSNDHFVRAIREFH